MKKNNNSEIVAAVVNGLSTAWKGYKSYAARRHQDPFSAMINAIFGFEMSDVEAAKYLAKDIAEINDIIRTKRTEKKFNDIIDNSF